MLNLLNAAPIMWIAENHLHRVGLDRFGQVGERSHRYVACERSSNSRSQQPLPYFCHSRNVCSWVLEISAAPQLLT